jgi:hypothetical protein
MGPRNSAAIFMFRESEKIQDDVFTTRNLLAQVAHASQAEDMKSVLLQKVFLIITHFGVRDYYRAGLRDHSSCCGSV